MREIIKNYSFNTTLFDCIVCLGGHFDEAEIFTHFPDTTIIAADSGYHNLKKLSITPHYIVGDLDSVGKEELEQLRKSITIIHLEEQETNDFEKAVKTAISLGKKNILLLGINGGHFEHTLNNWSVFKRLSKEVNLVLYELGRYCFSLSENFVLTTKTNELISIIPQPKAMLSSKGLKWELDNLLMELGIKEGARNVALGTQIQIEIHSGEILLSIDSRLPFA